LRTTIDPVVVPKRKELDLGGVLAMPISPAIQRLAAQEISWELVAFTALTALDLVLRFWDVGARAMHHDESLHATYA